MAEKGFASIFVHCDLRTQIVYATLSALLFEKRKEKIMPKTFGQLVDELIVEMEKYETENHIPRSSREELFVELTEKSILFADLKKVPKRWKDPEYHRSKRTERRLARSMLQMLWEDGEEGLEGLKMLINGTCC